MTETMKTHHGKGFQALKPSIVPMRNKYPNINHQGCPISTLAMCQIKANRKTVTNIEYTISTTLKRNFNKGIEISPSLSPASGILGPMTKPFLFLIQDNSAKCETTAIPTETGLDLRYSNAFADLSAESIRSLS